MNCADMEPLVLLQDSGEISEAQKQELVKHLSACSACRQQNTDLAFLRKTLSDGAQNLPEPSQQILAHIRTAAQHRYSPKMSIWTRPWPIALAAAASLALCLTSLRFFVSSSSVISTRSTQSKDAIEIIPLIAMITGTESIQLTMEGNETDLTVLANELLRLQDMTLEWPKEKMDTPTLPEDYQPTTLLWNNIRGPQPERCG